MRMVTHQIGLNYIIAEINLYRENGTVSDKDDNPEKDFPDISIDPDDYLLIWASGKDRGNSNVFRTIIIGRRI